MTRARAALALVVAAALTLALAVFAAAAVHAAEPDPDPGSGMPVPARTARPALTSTAPAEPAPASTSETAPESAADPTPGGRAPYPAHTAGQGMPVPDNTGQGMPVPDATEQPTPSGGFLADLCRKAPEPEVPGKSALDVIDFGAPAGDGLYARYRYAGWRSHLYNPGCMDAAILKVAEKAGGSVGMAGEAVTEEGGPNRATNIILSAARVGAALATAATRVATGELPVWDVVTQLSDSARTTFGRAALAAFLTVGVLLSIVWLAALWRRTDWGALGSALWRVFGITLIGVVLIGWDSSVGAMYDKTIADTHRATTAAVAGDDSGLSAGDVVGDAIMTHAYMPLWGAVHLGWDQEAIGTYTERLHAASAFTVDEAQRSAGSQDEFDDLVAAKKADYETVAKEIQTTHPDAYRVLEGKESGGRVQFAVLLLLVVAPIVTIAGFAAFLVIAARLIVRVGVGVYPILVAALQFPALQRWGVGIPRFILRWAVIGVVATAASVMFQRVLLVAALTEGGGSVFQRIAALTFVNVALIVGWLNRNRLATRIGMSGEYDALARSMHRLGDRIETLTERPRRAGQARFNEFRRGTPQDRTPRAVGETPDVKPAQPQRAASTRARQAAASTGPRPAQRVARAAAARTAAKAAPPQLRVPVAAATTLASSHRSRRSGSRDVTHHATTGVE